MSLPVTYANRRAAMTLDVEDWFHVENLRPAIARDTWDHRELRVEACMERILAALAARRTRATFFVLGWLAARRPQIVRDIAAQGHEIACHGDGHELVTRLTPDAFRRDVHRARSLLEDLAGSPVLGYRAPCFSITDWAIDELQQLGFAYDSSAFPVVKHDRYGRLAGLTPNQPVQEIRPGFYEVCVSVRRVIGQDLPWGGGGYFRLLPYRVFRQGVNDVLSRCGTYVFYSHPWEFDPGQPRIAGLSRLARFRHYVNLHRTEPRWNRLLDDFRWTTVADLVSHAMSKPERTKQTLARAA